MARRWRTMHRVYGRQAEPFCHAVIDRARGQDGHQNARATRVVMDMQPMVALIIVRPVVQHIVVIDSVFDMGMVTVMSMAILVMCVRMNEQARKRAGGYCTGHAECRRNGKRQHQRPNEDEAALVCFLQLRQHRAI